MTNIVSTVNTKKTATGTRLLLGYVGYILLFWGVCFTLPLLTIFFFPGGKNYAWIFISLSLFSLALGGILASLLRKREQGILSNHQDALILTTIWLVSTILCGLPYLLFGKYNFAQSCFESISGLSTTGLTVFPDIDQTPKIILMWRSFTMLFGGIGLVLSLAMILSGGHGAKIYSAEGHVSRPLPNFIKSARVIFAVYFFYILLGTTLYHIYGMTLFDAFNHSICVLATGGFSTHDANIGYYKSAAIDWVSIFLMFLGTVNFYTHVMLFSGKFKKFVSHSENKGIFALTIPFAIILAFCLTGAFKGLMFWDSFRVSVFYIMSAMSTTGFSTATQIPFASWPFSGLIIVLLFFIIGGSTESTAGGIKIYRAIVAIKSTWWHIKQKWANKREVVTFSVSKYGERKLIDDKEMFNVSTFIFLYLAVCVIGSFLVSILGNHKFLDSWVDFTSALGNIGLSSGITSYATPDRILWINTIGMFLGRLEIVVVILAGMKVLSNVKRRITKRA